MTPIQATSEALQALQPQKLADGGVRLDAEAVRGASFADALGQMVATADARAKHADALAAAFAEGRSDDVHGTMIAVKEVEIDLRVLSNVRRKVLDAFHELWRMNV